MEFKMNEEVGFYTDLPFGRLDVAGDEEHGFRPYQLLVASLAVCSGGVLRKIMKKMRMEFEDIEIKTNVERNPEVADRVEKVHIHFIIKGTDLNEAKLHKALELTRKNCSMVRSVEGSIEIEETFELI
ncbi:OsmC family protein [Cytobacillus oceanisediminis]|uniref:Osmotically inducible protein C n=1 Tax=Cytobacillus oceanisediminis TaxID=665099 RepID=A0ABX3CZH6_9BACI|nr:MULTISPECIES: OsmC family protein [Cytobacillus]OHX50456.1 osmotically inducible protein C [Cytobacillus oceanisediminis]QOK27202.1 OsmC family protein [Cytobacillus oceanisediminis]